MLSVKETHPKDRVCHPDSCETSACLFPNSQFPVSKNPTIRTGTPHFEQPQPRVFRFRYPPHR